MIQRQIMASLGLTRRPKVPHRRDRNMSDADIERLLPLLQQRDEALNDTDSTARLYVVKRVHALLPTCKLNSAPASLPASCTLYSVNGDFVAFLLIRGDVGYHRRSQGHWGQYPQESKIGRAPKTEDWKALFHMYFYSFCLTKNLKFIASEYTKIQLFEIKKFLMLPSQALTP